MPQTTLEGIARKNAKDRERRREKRKADPEWAARERERVAQYSRHYTNVKAKANKYADLVECAVARGWSIETITRTYCPKYEDLTLEVVRYIINRQVRRSVSVA